jgi:hypothetical protein
MWLQSINNSIGQVMRVTGPDCLPGTNTVDSLSSHRSRVTEIALAIAIKISLVASPKQPFHLEAGV